MEPQTPASFIPKKSLDSSMRVRSSGALGGLLFLVGLFVFIVSVLSAGGVFAYERYLTASIADKSASLQKAKEAFDLSAIEALSRMDTRIKQAETLLQKHVAASAIFSFLSVETLQNVQFTSFEYALQDDGSAAIVLDGIAGSFSTLALQSDQFGASQALSDVVFSGIKIETGGKVTFNVKATVDPTLLNYARNLTITPAALPQAPATTTAATTATTTRTTASTTKVTP